MWPRGRRQLPHPPSTPTHDPQPPSSHTLSLELYTPTPNLFTALLELGADPNALNKMGAAPVHVMLGAPSRSATPASLVQIATLLKDAGADLDATSGHPAVPASYLAVEQGELDLLCAPPVIRERHARPAPGNTQYYAPGRCVIFRLTSARL